MTRLPCGAYFEVEGASSGALCHAGEAAAVWDARQETSVDETPALTALQRVAKLTEALRTLGLASFGSDVAAQGYDASQVKYEACSEELDELAAAVGMTHDQALLLQNWALRAWLAEVDMNDMVLSHMLTLGYDDLSYLLREVEETEWMVLVEALQLSPAVRAPHPRILIVDPPGLAS